MVIINGKEFAPKISNSVLMRYASYIGVGVSKLITLLEDITPANLVGVFVFAARLEKLELTEDEVWEAIDDDMNLFSELANHLTNQLTTNIPDEGKKKKAAK